jgi:hypothetical protein
MDTPFTSPLATAHPDVQAIMARPPARLIRWGNVLLLLLVGGLLASTALVRYAERVRLPLRLVAAGAAPTPRIVPAVRPGTEVGSVLVAQPQLRYLREGQALEVSFEAYPAGEFGTVRAQLAQLADAPEADGRYRAWVTFPQGLQTSTKQRLPVRAGMRATAELVVASRPLLQQLFPQLAGPTGGQ